MAVGSVRNSETYFAKKLAHNDQKIRIKTLRKLKVWMLNRSKTSIGMCEEDILKIWKGLFYCMWFSDKPLVQEELSSSLASVIHIFLSKSPETGILFSNLFFATIGREWIGIDHLRLNKFYNLTKQMLIETLTFARKLEWRTDILLVMTQFQTECMLSEKYPDSLKKYITEYWMSSFHFAISEEDKKKSPPAETLALLLEPFLTAFAFCESISVLQCIQKDLLDNLLTEQSIEVPYSLIAERLSALAAKVEVKTKNRKLLFQYANLCKSRKMSEDHTEDVKLKAKKKKKRKKTKLENEESETNEPKKSKIEISEEVKENEEPEVAPLKNKKRKKLLKPRLETPPAKNVKSIVDGSQSKDDNESKDNETQSSTDNANTEATGIETVEDSVKKTDVTIDKSIFNTPVVDSSMKDKVKSSSKKNKGSEVKPVLEKSVSNEKDKNEKIGHCEKDNSTINVIYVSSAKKDDTNDSSQETNDAVDFTVESDSVKQKLDFVPLADVTSKTPENVENASTEVSVDKVETPVKSDSLASESVEKTPAKKENAVEETVTTTAKKGRKKKSPKSKKETPEEARARRKSLRSRVKPSVEDEPMPINFVKTPPVKAMAKKKDLTRTEPVKTKKKKVAVVNETEFKTPQPAKKIRIDLSKNESIAKNDLKISPLPVFQPDKQPSKSALRPYSTRARSRAADFF